MKEKLTYFSCIRFLKKYIDRYKKSNTVDRLHAKGDGQKQGQGRKGRESRNGAENDTGNHSPDNKRQSNRMEHCHKTLNKLHFPPPYPNNPVGRKMLNAR